LNKIHKKYLISEGFFSNCVLFWLNLSTPIHQNNI
jgi:hypothetical protein